MKKNWRQTHWKDFSSGQKLWFVMLCILLATILALACLSTSGIAEIPDWLTLLVVAASLFVLCKFLRLTPWALMGSEGDDDEDDDDI